MSRSGGAAGIGGVAGMAAGVVLLALLVGAGGPEIELVADDRTWLASHLATPPLGHTGGFDEPTCLTCHFEFEVNPEGGTMTVDGVPRRYRAGRSYRVRIEIEAGDMAVGGFQAAFRFAGGAHTGRQAGVLRTLDEAVAVRDSAGVQYAHHTRAGSLVTEPDRVEWAFEWTAPDAVDAVVMHVVANSGNGDDSPLGDWVFVQEHTSTRR